MLLAAPDSLGVAKSLGVKPLADVATGGGRAATAGLVSAMAAQPAGSRETSDPFSGDDALVSWARVPSAGWTLVTVTPSSEVFAAATSLRNTLIVIAVAVALVVAVGVWLVMSRLLRPVTRIREGARRIAGGRLDMELPPASADEFGQVSAAFAGMLEYLRRAAAYLRQIAAGDLSRSFPLASDADELGSALNEMHAGLSRIVATVAGQTDNLQDAAQVLAERVDSLGEASGRVRDESAAAASGARDFATGVGDIARSVTESSRLAASARDLTASMSNQLENLSQSSTGIENLISVIDNIAEQTRLLALNATIEAARAGAAGKGFAVVAEEVKALAQETSRATDDVAERVSAIRGDVDGTVEAVRRITASIEAMAGLQDTVASATGEQSANSGQVSERMSGVAAAAADTQRDVEANRELVRRLRETTADLHAAVAGFRI
jgi:methyl-accepting chemotaxis protein